MIHENDQIKMTNLLKKIRAGKWTQEIIADGKTNRIVLCKNDNKKFIARVFGRGTKKFLNREREKQNLKILANHSIAPPIKASWNNGYILPFIEGVPLKDQDMPKYAKHIARKLQKMHSVPIYGTPTLFDTLLNWYWQAHPKHKKILDGINALDLIQIGRKRAKPCKIAFCHNDLLSSNIILSDMADSSFDDTKNEENLENNILKPSDIDNISKLSDMNKSSSINKQNHSTENLSKSLKKPYRLDTNKEIGIEFIDFEYSGVNYAALDIANHFCEYFGYNLTKYEFPSDQQIIEFIKSYLSASIEIKTNLNDTIVQKLLKDVKFFVPLAHLFWAIWALLKSDIDNTEFDYYEYGNQKLGLIDIDFDDWYPSKE